jgi:hypothetical protein
MTATLTAPGQASTDTDNCPSCHGAGYIPDDGSVTDIIGWPIPCLCADAIPARVAALFTARKRGRSAILSAPPSVVVG